MALLEITKPNEPQRLPVNYEARYEDYVQRIFAPCLKRLSSTGSEQNSEEDAEEGEDADMSPMDDMYKMYHKHGIMDNKLKKFPVYEPKSSSEYFSTMLKQPKIKDSPSFYYKLAKLKRMPNIWLYNLPMEETRYRLSFDVKRFQPPYHPKNLLIEYGNFKPTSHTCLMKPLSPALFPNVIFNEHPEDTRYLGSNFAMLSLRPPSYFMDRVDRLLKDAKKYRR